ncbi:helix-turn-helix domain-containing protein [Nocardia terpenica]|uniref:Transcriptional regulator n=1 Tax=Nocardia terpenica TaxID=455432 RepID=A0A291RNE2_9NOCA|nr:helix-turn-helix domain-containing protein [Nocardia terpenica]ATL68810.1 transcriptional regulator [Nocardia terpenica]
MAMSPRPNDDIGARIRMHRERTGRTQAVIAGLAGISADYLGQIERGRKTPSATVLRMLASALGVPVGTLLGDHTEVTRSVTGGADQLALALMSRGAEPSDPAELARRVKRAWAAWQSSGQRYSEVLPDLPSLISDTEATLRGLRGDPQHRKASATASDLYGLLRTVTRRIGRTDLSFVVADRALRAAEDSADPLRLAVARWNLGHALLISGEFDAALELTTHAADSVINETGSDTVGVAMAGALQLVAAIAESCSGQAWAARDRLCEAHRMAQGSKEITNIGYTAFSTFNVGLHALHVELEGGDATEALRIADELDVVECPSIERRYSFALDLARAYELRREETGMLLHLLDAERIAAEDLRQDANAHEMVRRLVRSPRASNRTQAARLAHRLNLTV